MTHRRSLIAIVWATAVWTALWGSLSVANILAGTLVGIATVAIVPVPAAPRTDVEGTPRIQVGATLGFFGYFLRALVVASAVVAWEVVTPRNRINQGIVRLPLRTRSRGVATVIANAISLTPGTVTLEIAEDPLTLYVHVLHLREVEQVRSDLRELEERALRAFDPAAAELPVPDGPVTDREVRE